MATKKKLLEAAAGAAGGAALNVEDVFSTYVYTGTSVNPNTITNGIDLAGEGGLVWLKTRTASFSHTLFDTERGVNKYLSSDATTAESTGTSVTSFNSDGFTLGTTSILYNSSSYKYASWTFRKAPKFFDVQTFTTTYNNNPNVISHNLESDLGCAIFKQLNSTGQGYNWIVWHRSLGLNKYLILNGTNSQTSDTNSIKAVDNSAGTISFGYPMSNVADRLVSGSTETTSWVGYFFAHNNGDGNFGPTKDQDIIKCGSYSGDGTSNGTNVVTLGWEPQWLLIKNTTSADSWVVMDNMRGLVNGGGAVGADGVLFPDTSGSEAGWDLAHPTATGFTFTSAGGNVNQSGQTYIYIAIRRGPMAVPESATEVFDIKLDKAAGLPGWISSTGVVDFAIRKYDYTVIGSKYIESRLQGSKAMTTESTAAEVISPKGWDYNTGYTYSTGTTAVADYAAWMWKRAPNFFDVVCYDGTGTTQTLSHNLGVAPEMIWVKSRSHATDWIVYDKEVDMTQTYQLLKLNDLGARSQNVDMFGSTHPTSSSFTIGSTNTRVNGSGRTYIAYLFASLDGVSKVGSYTGNGSTQTINCGFSSGARFVLIKRTDSTGDWYVWDAERGIVSANDPHLSLNTTAAEVTTDDSVDPVSSGFAVNQVAATNINVSSASYIYYAVS